MEIVENDNNLNLNELNITYPENWTKRGTEIEMFFDDENKQTVGGISLVGYYGDYNATLPNHSEILRLNEAILPPLIMKLGLKLSCEKLRIKISQLLSLT